MLTVAEAHQLIADHLGTWPRAAHSRFVGFAMRRLAELRQAPVVLWELVGLCHDLDYAVTRPDPTRHGLVAAGWLSERLPPEALTAIAAHDHRTGVSCETELCDALRLADALAVVCRTLGPDTEAALAAPDARPALEARLTDRPFLTPLLLETAARLDVPLSALAAIASEAPPPA